MGPHRKSSLHLRTSISIRSLQGTRIRFLTPSLTLVIGPLILSRTYLGCTNPNWFTFLPSDTSFYLDAGQSRIYTITFQPATTITTSLNACLNFYFDDASQPEVINLTGVEKQRTIKYGTNVIDFGRVKVGDDSLQTDSVENQSSPRCLF